MTLRGFETLGVLACVMLLSCSGDTQQGDCRCGAGGAGNSGGTSGGGGSQAFSSGGVVAIGGGGSGSATSTGGVSATGGGVQTGGSVSTGGTDPGMQPDLCDLPFEVGPCDAAIPVYWFNAQTGDCEMQSYGGCGGNANRFDTLDACMQACGGSNPKACQVDADCGWSEIDHEILQADDCICLYGCPYVILNQSTVSRRQQQYDSLCDPMTDGQGQPCGIDDCIQPPPLTCVGGQCEAGSTTN